MLCKLALASILACLSASAYGSCFNQQIGNTLYSNCTGGNLTSTQIGSTIYTTGNLNNTPVNVTTTQIGNLSISSGTIGNDHYYKTQPIGQPYVPPIRTKLYP